MSEYVTIDGQEYRRVYEIWADGDELGVLLNEAAANALVESIEGAGACDVWCNYYLQPIERATWFVDCLGLVHE